MKHQRNKVAPRLRVPNDPFISEPSVEEAGHAVMSAHLRLQFSNVHINNKNKPGEVDGSVGHIFDRNRAKRDPGYIRRHALVSLAGAAAQRVFFPSSESTVENSQDLALVYYVYQFSSDEWDRLPPFDDLKKECDKIFKGEDLRFAIKYVARILTLEGRISSKEVRSKVRPASLRVRQSFLNCDKSEFNRTVPRG